ncbi:MAG: hypothetical protein HZB41_06550 [Ignavibacteriae bacterium]|nr:hypothetical protein [Ignavibacteriota bacterium]
MNLSIIINKNFKIFLIFFFLFFSPANYLFSLDDKEEILPLKIGNEWIENICRYSSSGKVNCHKRITKVTGDTLIKGKKYYIIEVSDSNGNVQSRNYYINEPDGLYVYIKNKLNMILKYPVQTGEIFRGVNDTIKVDSMDVPVIVFGKNFKCIRFSVERNDKVSFKMIIYCSPGIGRILYEIYEREDEELKLKEKWELMDYKIK